MLLKEEKLKAWEILVDYDHPLDKHTIFSYAKEQAIEKIKENSDLESSEFELKEIQLKNGALL